MDGHGQPPIVSKHHDVTTLIYYVLPISTIKHLKKRRRETGIVRDHPPPPLQMISRPISGLFLYPRGSSASHSAIPMRLSEGREGGEYSTVMEEETQAYKEALLSTRLIATIY
jgi:hypothetical protein